MAVFYSYSNNSEESCLTYNKVYEKINDIIIDIDNNLLNKIKNHINHAYIFLCNITTYYRY